MLFENNCPILEVTVDGHSAGRCWFHLPDGKTCERHGDVSEARELYVATGLAYPRGGPLMPTETRDPIEARWNTEFGMDLPTCTDCGGCGLGYGSVEHHHRCASAPDGALTADNEHWGYLGHNPYVPPTTKETD